MSQREVDKRFVKRLRKFLDEKLSRKQKRKMTWRERGDRWVDRQAARLMIVIFQRRIDKHTHSYPSPRMQWILKRFTYKRYCGVGHGTSSGETRRALGPVDAACKEHDEDTEDLLGDILH